MKRYDYIFNPVIYFGVGLLPMLYLCTSASEALRFGFVLVLAMIASLSVILLFKPLIYQNIRIPCFVLVVVGVEYFVDSVVSEFWVDSYSGISSSIYYLFVATIIIFALEYAFREKSVKRAYLNCVNIGLEYYLMLVVVGVVREILGSGTLFGNTFLGFNGMEFFHSLAGAMLVVICYASAYMAIATKIQNKVNLRNQLTDRYFTYMKENCTLTRKTGEIKPNVSKPAKQEGGDN